MEKLKKSESLMLGIDPYNNRKLAYDINKAYDKINEIIDWINEQEKNNG